MEQDELMAEVRHLRAALARVYLLVCDLRELIERLELQGSCVPATPVPQMPHPDKSPDAHSEDRQ